MSLKIGSLKKDDTDQVIKFFNSAQSDRVQSNNRTKQEFEWLFFNGLFKPAIYTIASDEQSGEIAATFAGIYIPMISPDGESVITIKGEDTLLSLDKMIGSGKRDILKELFNAITDKARSDNACFFWGFTPSKSAFKRCGFSIVTQIKNSFFVFRPGEFYRYQVRRFPETGMMGRLRLLGFSWYNYLSHLSFLPQAGGLSMKPIGYGETNENLLLSFLPKNMFSTCLSKEFLKWRIADNPSPMTYEILEFRNNSGEIISYFILSYNKENIWFVEQFLFRHDISDKMKIKIIKKSLSYCKKQNAIMIRALGFSHNSLNISEMKLLTRAGFYFFRNPEESYFVFFDLTGRETDPADIYLSRLNTQGIR
jgi:hypothetical protein